MRGRVKYFAFLLLIGLVLLGVAGATQAAKDGRDKDWDNAPIIFISLDTTRKDALSLYGYGNGQTPNLDAFSKDCVVFYNHFSEIPHTLPSHMALMTGIRPDSHGVLGRKQSLSLKVKTMAEYLKGNGYKTAGVYSFWWLKPEYGFKRGFDNYTYCQYGLRQAERTNGFAIKDLNAMPKDKKFFMFIHYYDAHSDFIKGQKLPYLAPPALIKKYTQGYEGHFIGGEVNSDSYASPYLMKVNKDVKLRANFPAQDLKLIRGLYAAGVEYMDINLGVLFNYLKKQGIYDKALIIVAADHGEEFLEHNMFIHEQMYDELVKIPLMMKFPKSKWAGRKVDEMEETIDLLPTILEFAGVKGEDYLQGESLFDILEGRKWNKQFVLIRDPHKVKAHAFRTKTDELMVWGDKFQYFDLTKDPNQKVPIKNIKAVPKERVDQMKEALKDTFALAKKVGKGPVKPNMTKEEEEKLRSLGYIN